MPESIEKISLNKLQNVTYQLNSAFQLNADGQEINCHQLIRVVPGKRLVFIGEFNKTKVIIKLFVHSSRAKKHWLRECAGADLLSEHDILTPEKIIQGRSDTGVYYLIFRYIEGQDLAAFWTNSLKAGDLNSGDSNSVELCREKKLKQLMPVLEQHHSAGLAHQDLHYANFLLGESETGEQAEIYTLDGEEVKSSAAALNKAERLNNLALFLAQTFDLSKSSCISLLHEYISLTSFESSNYDVESFFKKITFYQQQRIDQYLKKILRECTEVIFKKQQQAYTLCRRQEHKQNVQQLLAQPEVYFEKERLQNKDSIYLKQGNTCTVIRVLIDNEQFVIKRYNPKGIAYELMHKGQMSRARKSWVNAHLLRFMGILTPEPVALIEQYPTLGKRCSYFITRYVEGPDSWTFFCDKDPCDKEQSDKEFSDKKLLADDLLSLLKKLGEFKITHGDLKGSNFLISENKIWIFDLDAMKQNKTNWQYKKNWLRDKQRFLKNWEQKACYEQWKDYFNKAFSSEKAII